MRILRMGLAAAVAAIGLTDMVGCATTHRSASGAAALPGTPACFWRQNFLGNWQVLNNSSLILYTLPSDRNAYLIRLFQPVVGLNFNMRLGLLNRQSTSQICGNLNAYLLIPGNTPSRILITDVRRLTEPERNQLLAQAGHSSPRHEASNSDAEAH